jgi:hypothetical protein
MNFRAAFRTAFQRTKEGESEGGEVTKASQLKWWAMAFQVKSNGKRKLAVVTAQYM